MIKATFVTVGFDYCNVSSVQLFMNHRDVEKLVFGYNGGGLYLLLLRLHEWVSLAACRINAMREILKWVTFCYRQHWIRSLVCIQKVWNNSLAINSASYKNPKHAANMLCLYMKCAMKMILIFFLYSYLICLNCR